MELMSLVSERVKILFEGVWQESQVEIVEDDQYLPKITEEMKVVAADRFANRKKKNPELFDGAAERVKLKRKLRRHVAVL